jgi:hypothetical protein
VQGGGDFVSGEVGHEDPDPLVGEDLKIIQVAPDGVGLDALPGDLQTADPGRRRRWPGTWR